MPAAPDRLAFPFDTRLHDLGRDLGMAQGEALLCLINTAAEYQAHDLARAVRRLHDLARIVGATVWVQCFDTEPQGPMRTLESLAAQIDAIGLADGPFTPERDVALDGVFSGWGGNDGARALSRVWREQAQWPPGLARNRVLVVFDGLDVHPWSERVDWPEGPRPQVLGLVIQQRADHAGEEQKRVAYARQRCPEARMVPGHALGMALEQRELFLAMRPGSGPDQDPTPMPARTVRRL